jgi:SAM-dependent methyltransferase
VEHDLTEPLPELGRFDAVVSSMAIHHLEHERKRSLYGEVFDLLKPGGVFANFEHVASPTYRLHLAFFAAIDEPLEDEDPSDRLLDVESQVGWLRALGFDDVNCYWKWLAGSDGRHASRWNARSRCSRSSARHCGPRRRARKRAGSGCAALLRS